MYDSTPNTLRHIGLVQEQMARMIADLQRRSDQHDQSKLVEPEKSGIDGARERLLAMEYGTKEYTELRNKAFGDHHHAVNDHHVEHYENGIFDMTLMAFVEMYCDWVAAVMTHGPEDNIYKSIELHKDMFGPLGTALFTNTAKAWGL